MEESSSVSVSEIRCNTTSAIARKCAHERRNACVRDDGKDEKLRSELNLVDIEVLEREALKLTPEQRARLARELLESLDALPPEELDRLWLDEASHRAHQIDTGAVELISGEEVDRKARALLR